MSVSSILNIAKNALSASQVSVQTTSHNIANVNTEGYSRQQAVLEEMTPLPTSNGFMGNGVTVKRIISYYDQYLQKSISARGTDLEGQKVYEQYLTRIEGILNEDNSRLSQGITDFFDAWHELSTDPTSMAAKQSVASGGENLASIINGLYNDLKNLQTELNNTVSTEIDDINTTTASIASLNTLIFNSGSGTSEANDYIDQRNQLLEKLSGKINVNYFSDEHGRVTVMTSGGKSLVDGGTAWKLTGIQDEETGMMRVGWQDPAGGVADLTDAVTSGSLGALIDTRDTKINAYISDLDSLAKSVIENVNAFHQLGNGGAGVAFFQPVSQNYARGIHLSDGIVDSSGNIQLANIMVTSSTENAADNDVALRIATLGGETLLGGHTITSKTFSSDTAVGASGQLFVNGVSVTVSGTDSLTDIAGKLNLVRGQTEVSASVTHSTSGYELVLSAASTDLHVSVVNGDPSASSGTITQTLGLAGSTYTNYSAGVVAKIGQQTKSAGDLVEYNQAAMTTLKEQRADVSGVSIDEEMANLIKFQNAYQAAARLYTVANDLLKTLMEAV